MLLLLRNIKQNSKCINAKCYYSNLSNNNNDNTKRLKTDFNILINIFRTIWPPSSSISASASSSKKGVKTRVAASMSLLLATKLINVQVPFIFKSIVDSFEYHTMNNSLNVMNVITNTNTEITPIIDIMTTVSPITLVLLYGASRSAAAGASELKVI